MNEKKKIIDSELDILLLFKFGNEIGWKDIHESSIYRFLYLSTVTFNFVYTDLRECDLFSDTYDFTAAGKGPYSENIDKALNYLVSQGILEHRATRYCLLSNNLSPFEILPNYKAREAWIQTMVYIFGVFGENKLYDFFYRDPQLIYSIKSNSKKVIETGIENQSVQILNMFKSEFEEIHKERLKELKLNNRKYLKLYFEYIFNRIIRGEQ